MNLIPIQYTLDEYELPEHRFVSGTLDIEIDHVDGNPYIWAFDVKVENRGTGISVEHYFQDGRKDNWLPSVELRKELHQDKRLMDDVFDECAREGMWS